MSEKKANLTKSVMTQIHKKKVKMKPRSYFIIGSFLLGIGLTGVLVLTIFFVNLMTFRLRTHNPFSYLWFGHSGLKPFLVVFPWWPLLLIVGGFAGGIILLKRHDISYKKGFLVLIIGLIISISTLGFLLDKMNFNGRTKRLKPLRPLYQSQCMGEDWIFGSVVEAKDREIKLVTSTEEEILVKWDEETLLPLGSDFEVGERIKAIGEWQEGIFVAEGIVRNRRHRQLINSQMDEQMKDRPFKRNGNNRRLY